MIGCISRSMLLHVNGWSRTVRARVICSSPGSHSGLRLGRRTLAVASTLGWAISLSTSMLPAACSAEPEQEPESETLSNIPQELSGECKTPKDCRKPRIQRPKSRKAESCTTKCVTTCIRGGDGSPGEGPLNIRGPLVVFKEGFRSRRYCLVECSDICNLIGDQDYGP